MQKEKISGYDTLLDLALDMRWSWNHEADDIWQELDPVLWDQSHNPIFVLQTMSADDLLKKSTDTAFQAKISRLLQSRDENNKAASWFDQNHASSPLKCVAYFSMEFMLSEALPIYVGGLGNVAGDQLKSASDLGVPVVGVGLLYQQGYYRQIRSEEHTSELQSPC